MKTVILASPNQYGYFTIYYNYANYLSKEVNVIYVCFDQGEIKFKESENIKVVYVSLGKNKVFRIFNYYLTIVRIFNSNIPATLILKYYFFSFLLNLFIPRKDLILDIRTGYISEIRLKTFFFNLIIRTESLLFERIITLSESLRKKLKLRINKTTIVPLGADQVDSPSKTFDNIVLLYVGTLISRNISKTVEGLAQFIESGGSKLGIIYYIVGGGNSSEVNILTDTIHHFNLQGIVHYEGQIYGENLKWYFRNCNVGVSYIPLIKDYDCQPATKTIEYLMAGMPVIATETSENKNIISGYNGILIKDDPQSFAEGLKNITVVNDNFNSEVIKNSVKDYSFDHIINCKLKPLLFSE